MNPVHVQFNMQKVLLAKVIKMLNKNNYIMINKSAAAVIHTFLKATTSDINMSEDEAAKIIKENNTLIKEIERKGKIKNISFAKPSSLTAKTVEKKEKLEEKSKKNARMQEMLKMLKKDIPINQKD